MTLYCKKPVLLPSTAFLPSASNFFHYFSSLTLGREELRMELFSNLVYEYKKGVRDLVLFTCTKSQAIEYLNYLNKLRIKYLVVTVGGGKINLFFGNNKCLQILKAFSSLNLDEISAQEDFILGIMLGYSRAEQYSRLLAKSC